MSIKKIQVKLKKLYQYIYNTILIFSKIIVNQLSLLGFNSLQKIIHSGEHQLKIPAND